MEKGNQHSLASAHFAVAQGGAVLAAPLLCFGTPGAAGPPTGRELVRCRVQIWDFSLDTFETSGLYSVSSGESKKVSEQKRKWIGCHACRGAGLEGQNSGLWEKVLGAIKMKGYEEVIKVERDEGSNH